MVRRVAGRVHGAEHELGGLDHVAVGHRPVDGEAVARVEGQHLGAGAGLEAGDAGGVVGVGVGADDPADAVAAAAGDGVEVAGVVGPGIDHHDLVDADEVGVGARAGHHPRVGGHDAPHQRAQRAGHAVDERLAAPRLPRRRRARRRLISCTQRRGRRGGRMRQPPPSSTAARVVGDGQRVEQLAATVAKRPTASRLRIVGRIRSKPPAAWRSSASAGRIQQLSVCSRSSWAWSPSGARATKKRVSKRAGRALRGDPVRQVVEVVDRRWRGRSPPRSRGAATQKRHRGQTEPARPCLVERCRRRASASRPRRRGRPTCRRTPCAGGAAASAPRAGARR